MNRKSPPNNIVGQLLSDEGVVLHAYQDHLGFWTIGVGRLIDKRRGGGITQEEALYLLYNDIKRKTEELELRLPWVGKLDDARKGALLNMAFQLGVVGLLGFKTTLALIRSGDFAKASVQMLKSKWAQQTPERAQRIAEQIRTGVWQ